MKFLHSSDFQLGMTRKFLGQAQERFDDARDQAIQNLAGIADDQDCEFVVLAGDIFDANNIPERIFYQAVDSFLEFQMPVYILPGNHDALVSDSILARLAEEVPNVVLLRDTSLHSVRPGVEVFGAPLLARHPGNDLMTVALSDKEPTENVRIMVGHGQFDSYGDSKHFDLSIVEEALAQHKISYLAMGDTHSAGPIGKTNKIWFSGAPEVTDFYDVRLNKGEINSGKALIVSATNENVSVEEVTVGSWQFLTYSADLRSDADVSALIAEWKNLPQKKNIVLKTKVGGKLSLAGKEEYNGAIEKFEKRFAAIFPSKSSPEITIIPNKSELVDVKVAGYVGEVYGELLEESSTDPIAAQALLELYSLLQRQEQV
ncbi:MAG: DNA repair exonuclease [Corynebacterium sp.]|nr:DNA repair exonuclease [Corynebacterium sp.]